MEDSVTNSMSTKYFPFTREPKGYTDASSGAKGGGFFKPSGGGSTNNLGTTVPMLNGAPINSTGTNPYSLRTQRANWASGAKKKMNNFNNSLQAGGEDGEGAASNPLSKATGVDAGISESILLNECRKNGPRLMVFVIGGITYSEIRSCYEIMREWRREVIIGKRNGWK